MKLSDRIVRTPLLTTLADLHEADEAPPVEHAQARYDAMRKHVAIKDADMRELVVGEGEHLTNLLEAARTFAKTTCLEQCEQVWFMAAWGRPEGTGHPASGKGLASLADRVVAGRDRGGSVVYNRK